MIWLLNLAVSLGLLGAIVAVWLDIIVRVFP
jgi:hypothetical protein